MIYLSARSNQHPVRDALLGSTVTLPPIFRISLEMRPNNKRLHLYEMQKGCLGIFLATERCISYEMQQVSGLY